MRDSQAVVIGESCASSHCLLRIAMELTDVIRAATNVPIGRVGSWALLPIMVSSFVDLGSGHGYRSTVQ